MIPPLSYDIAIAARARSVGLLLRDQLQWFSLLMGVKHAMVCSSNVATDFLADAQVVEVNPLRSTIDREIIHAVRMNRRDSTARK